MVAKSRDPENKASDKECPLDNPVGLPFPWDISRRRLSHPQAFSTTPSLAQPQGVVG